MTTPPARTAATPGTAIVAAIGAATGAASGSVSAVAIAVASTAPLANATRIRRVSVRCWYRLVAVALLLATTAVRAQSADDVAEDADPEADSALTFLQSLRPQSGDVQLPNGKVTLHLGDAYYWLDPADAERVLVEAWGNPPGNQTEGMIFPAGATPLDGDSWGIVLSYAEDGHVDDADAADIDYDAMLEQMQADDAESNEQRAADGYPPIATVGWAAPPRYDAARHTLHWAKELRFGDSPDHTLNYNVRTLGRTGVLEMNFVAGMAQLPDITAAIDTVLRLPEYQEGHRYADFDPDLDDVAAYGIGALVAGKVAAKFGLLAAALLFLKKFWFVVLAGVPWLWRRVRGGGAAGGPPAAN